jgi:transaldolase
VRLFVEAADPAELRAPGWAPAGSEPAAGPGATAAPGTLLVVSERELDGIVARAAELGARSPGLVFGLPATDGGLRALRGLTAGRFRTAVLGCPTPEAALAAARAGAGYLAPARAPSGRVVADSVRKLASLLRTFDYKAVVLVSAVRTLDELTDAAMAGARAAGVSREVAARAASRPR